MDLTLLIWYFFCYAILGYIVEVLYCSIRQGTLVNRGFLHGPYLPIYGFGAVLVIFIFARITNNPFVLFFISVIGTSILEYATGYLSETLFSIRLWDYSTAHFNLKGRICLLNSTLFGLLSLFVTYGVHPHLSALFEHFTPAVMEHGAKIIIILFSVDTTISVLGMSAFQRQLAEFREKRREIEIRLKVLHEFKENKMLEGLRVKLDTELDELRMRLSISAKRILHAFPSLTSSNEEKRLLLETLRKTIRETALHKKLHDKKHRSDKRDD
nr:putative ABC transporter permease [uncultured Sphaerochaeta sp.]